MFRKAKIEDGDVEMYLNGLVSKESPTFRVVVEKIAKLKRTLKHEVFWPASLKWLREYQSRYALGAC